MADVNFVQYGMNALRVQQSAGDFISFGAQNGYVLGTILAVVIVMVLILFIFVFFSKKGHSLISQIFH